MYRIIIGCTFVRRGLKMPSLNHLTVRCTPEEYKEIEQRAKANNMKLSEYVRFVCLNAKIEVKIEGK